MNLWPFKRKKKVIVIPDEGPILAAILQRCLETGSAVYGEVDEQGIVHFIDDKTRKSAGRDTPKEGR